uniref:Uncharacterized protein n=1 Tax=Manihot esculenta TaxID=3983 RepID=A0A2C9UJ93_MANES
MGGGSLTPTADKFGMMTCCLLLGVICPENVIEILSEASSL